MSAIDPIQCPFCNKPVFVHITRISGRYWLEHANECHMRMFMAQLDEPHLRTEYPNIDFDQFNIKCMAIHQIADALLEFNKKHNFESLLAMEDF